MGRQLILESNLSRTKWCLTAAAMLLLGTASSAAQVKTIRLELTVEGDAQIDVKNTVRIAADVLYNNSKSTKFTLTGKPITAGKNNNILYSNNVTIQNGQILSDRITLYIDISGIKTTIELNPKYIQEAYPIDIDVPNVRKCGRGIFRAIETPASKAIDSNDSIKIIVKAKLTRNAMIANNECRQSAISNKFKSEYLRSALIDHGNNAVRNSARRITRVY